MGFRVILRLITFLALFVGGDPLVLRSSDHVSSPALTPTSARSLAPNHYDKHSPSKHHATRWTKRGLRPFSSISFQRYHHERPKVTHFAPTPSYQVQPPTYAPQGSPGSAPSPVTSRFGPSISPSSSSLTKDTADPPTSVFALPPPPPNEDCATVTCTQPLTYTPAGSPCACVWPIEIKLRLAISPYTFFPLVSELAHEISTSVSLNVSQARIMGANADGEQLDKTIVLVNLVPLKQNFDPATAFSIYQKFWKKQVLINKPRFGAYEVVNIKYPGLPPSPPSVPLNGDVTVDQSDSLNNNKGMPYKPIGVDIPRNGRENKSKTNGSMVTVVILSSVTAFVVIIGAFWLLLIKCGCCCYSGSQTEKYSPARTVSQGKPSGTGESLIVGSRKSSETMSFSSSLLAYTGTAKIYSLSEIEKATDNFDSRNILGEGGFGVVYSGILEDERKVAVKVLKRDDRQGSREFLAEVEMLSRLHHRNLVKLFGICTHDHFRCLVYELVPNGSVESHLHGADKTAPLSWCARMKIALGAARGLAYLHEDSSPRVIHRDFKASNILLENDFTPKVSDFGLARTALDGHKHISTHVMGTFGYLAPEYAMTGHLLVKSDVYSYGVVLLELLTGRKPVDLLQPPGQENLVAWARPLLTNKEALESIIDPDIMNSNTPFDSILKVAAIASMCVQPEVSHRPFMGEVVQALKLVCNEFDEIRDMASRSYSRDDDLDFELMDQPESHHHEISGYDSKIGLSATDLRSTIDNVEGLESESFRRQFNSAPLKMGKRKQFWRRLRGLSRGSMSDHEHEHRFSSNL
ncbi:concanavalin A-like lectin/glucanase domain-containing protein [Artemisia annua]|uniref:Concanavalin A-like lectin/glucanase domain-containing protein n=1 Tax=Artemisia annua TaxID=35608 RepID=A0A2U1P5A2_ARTAN|nr:concanavalin A-like lectin/glucanase domain-containing protein [Artemisia annua]